MLSSHPKTHQMIKPYLLLVCCFSMSLITFGQDAQRDFETSSISIFKNGTAFFIKSGTVPTTDGTYRITDHLPPALFGTYWMNAPDGTLSSLSSYMDTLKTIGQVTANSVVEMLRANIGRRVVVEVKDKTAVQGTIVALEQNDLKTPQIVTLRTDQGHWKTLRMEDILSIEFFEQPKQQYARNREEVKPVLQADFSDNKREHALDLMYLARGLSWTPLYLIELTSEKRARLTLRAEVVNSIEDIDGTDVNFVVGVPNFSLANRLSPLVDFSNPYYPAQNRAPSSYDNLSNSLQAQTITYGVQEDMAFSVPAAASGLEGTAEEDLYFYTLKEMNLKKGGRGHYPVFIADINIAHIYECNLPQNNEDKYAYRDDYLFSPNPNTVFHSLKVVNDTRYPFTTGAAMVVKNQQDTKPISQDRLNYTPIGGHSFIKLTEAPDVHIKQAEKAVKREESVRKETFNRNTYFYDLLTITGQIEIKNYKAQKIDLNIRRTILGDLQESSVEWLKAERINAAGGLNELTDVCWETSVDAGAELKITYTYQIYVSH